MDRRQHYRVDEARNLAGESFVRLGRGSLVPVTLLDLSFGGAAVMVATDFAREMRQSPSLDLVIRSDRLAQPLDLPSKVTSAFVEGGHARTGLQFEDWGPARRVLEPAVKALFNMREAFRVTSDDTEPQLVVPVRFGEEAPVEGALRDVSVRGVGLRFPRALADRIGIGALCTVELSLPGVEGPLLLPASVAHMDDDYEVSHLLVGVQFADESLLSKAWAERVRVARRGLQSYVMTRQRALARLAAKLGGSGA